jgi:AcrR family transcriptional regulator
MRVGEKLKTEDALLRAAESLLERGGPDAVTTRAVCDAVNVGAPTLYYRYGDKNGLLDALVAKGVKAFLKRKQAGRDTDDALADLISGWESFIGFALERPQLFRLMVQRVGNKRVLLKTVKPKKDSDKPSFSDGLQYGSYVVEAGIQPFRIANVNYHWDTVFLVRDEILHLVQ